MLPKPVKVPHSRKLTAYRNLLIAEQLIEESRGDIASADVLEYIHAALDALEEELMPRLREDEYDAKRKAESDAFWSKMDMSFFDPTLKPRE